MAVKTLARCAVSEEIASLADTLKTISDVNRLRILCLLFGGEKCVCEIEGGLDISQPLASHHLKVLLDTGLVNVRREGTWSFYSLRREAIEALNRVLREFLGEDRIPVDYPGPAACFDGKDVRTPDKRQ